MELRRETWALSRAFDFNPILGRLVLDVIPENSEMQILSENKNRARRKESVIKSSRVRGANEKKTNSFLVKNQEDLIYNPTASDAVKGYQPNIRNNPKKYRVVLELSLRLELEKQITWK